MLRYYLEHPEFDAFSVFDTCSGRLTALEPEVFRTAVGEAASKGADVFTGPVFETHTRFPRRVYFQITRRCGLGCPACFLRADQDGAHVPTTAAKALAAYVGARGLMEVRLTGGEPTMHPDLLDILHAFQEAHVYPSLATNGMIGRRMLEALAEERTLWVVCSIDGDRDAHERVRPGTFDTIVANLSWLRERNPDLRLRLTAVLTRDNKDRIFQLGQLGKSLGAESITLIPLRPQVRKASVLGIMLNAAEFRGVLDEIVRTTAKLGIRFTTTIETEYRDQLQRDPIFVKRSSCAAGREGTNLDYDARTGQFILYGCSYSPASDLDALPAIRAPFLAGSFSADRIDAFSEIWSADARWRIFRDLSLRPSDCLTCGYRARGRCTGACPIQNIDYTSIDVSGAGSASGDVLAQLAGQLRATAEWYCYTRLG